MRKWIGARNYIFNNPKTWGTIDFTSELGKGTTFNILLPAMFGHIENISRDPPTQYTFTGNILIMEDNPSIQVILTKLLQKCGFQVRVILDLTILGDPGGKIAL